MMDFLRGYSSATVGFLLGMMLTGGASWAGHTLSSHDGQDSSALGALQYQQRQLQNEQREQQSLDRMLRGLGPC